MKLLTFKSVEEMVKKRVEKKAVVFGQEISLNSNDDKKGKSKFDPSVASQLYEKWVIPLTKEVQVEYLLRRLDWRQYFTVIRRKEETYDIIVQKHYVVLNCQFIVTHDDDLENNICSFDKMNERGRILIDREECNEISYLVLEEGREKISMEGNAN